MATTEFASDQKGRLLEYRDQALKAASGLGPLDACIVKRRSQGSYLPLFGSAATESWYLHWFIGAEVSSVAAICAYYQRLLSMDKGTYANTRGAIVGATVCVYDAFSGRDLRVVIDMDAKPKVRAVTVDTALRVHDGPPLQDIVDGASVSSRLREIAMPPSIVPCLAISRAASDREFRTAASRLLRRGALLRWTESPTLVSRGVAVSVLQHLTERHFKISGDIDGGIALFAELFPTNAMMGLSVARLLRARGRPFDALKVLVEALRSAPTANPLLIEQADLLLSLKQARLSLPIAKAAVEHTPMEISPWVMLARARAALGDPAGAIIALSGIADSPEPTEIIERDVHSLINLPDNAPSELRVVVRAGTGATPGAQGPADASAGVNSAATQRPAHEWAYYDIASAEEELTPPIKDNADLLASAAAADQPSILSNRLSERLLAAYKVLVSVWRSEGFDGLSRIIRERLVLTEDLGPAPAAAIASARIVLSAGATAAAEGGASGGSGMSAAEERRQKRLERRAAQSEKKLRRARAATGSVASQSQSSVQPRTPSRRGSAKTRPRKAGNERKKSTTAKTPTPVSPDSGDSSTTTTLASPGSTPLRPGSTVVVSAAASGGNPDAQVAVPVLSVSRVFAQPSAPKRRSSTTTVPPPGPTESPHSRAVARKHKLLRRRLRLDAKRRVREMRRKGGDKPAGWSTTRRGASRHVWGPGTGSAASRQMCGQRLSVLIAVLKEDIRAIQDARVKLNRVTREHKQRWREELAPTETAHKWLQLGRVARRLHLFPEAEMLLKLCLQIGYSRRAHEELAGVYIESGHPREALASLNALAGADDDGAETEPARQSVPTAVRKCVQTMIDKYKVGPVAALIDASDAVHRLVARVVAERKASLDSTTGAEIRVVMS